jgi:translation initiation factor IF-2
MTETKNTGEKTLSVAQPKTLTLKRAGVEQGMVRQSFSHGRTKAVVVEKVKRRAVGPAEAKAVEPSAPTPSSGATAPRLHGRAAPGSAQAAPQAAPSKPSGVVLRTLTEEERSARAHALADAKVREAEERKIAEEDARRRVERESTERIEREAAESRKRDEEERRRHDEEAKRKAEQEAKKRFGDDEAAKAKAAAPAAATPAAPPAINTRTAVLEPDEEARTIDPALGL